MTKYFRLINKIMQGKGNKLDKDDVQLIRDQYPLLSEDEFDDIGDIEEVIVQIAMNPQNKLTTSQIA
tara:strand:+ start:701 stop:901 length:201 start_codon:yes stop_codon:yes gene_type:complete